MASFVSEHTLEYMIVPRILDCLCRKFPNVVPIYFWSGREGNSLSAKIHGNLSFKMLAVFPRRPKLQNNLMDNLFGNVNESILKYAFNARTLGLPVIFSFPIIATLLDIKKDTNIIYFEFVEKLFQEIYFKVDKETKEFKAVNFDQRAIKILEETELHLLVESSQTFEWNEAVQNIKLLKRNNSTDNDNNFFPWSNSYKPIFFLIFEK